MCTPLRKRNIVAKLPMSVSSMGGEPVFLHLARALNGLRSASQEWVVFLSSIVDVLGLSTCSLEPCLFSGILPMGQPCLILVYVDDLSVTAPTCEALDVFFKKVGKEVKLKRIGTVGTSGQVRFLGPNISRQKGESSVLVSLPEDYLNETLEEYKIKGSSKCPPDITQYLDKENGSELSPAAYSRLRSALARSNPTEFKSVCRILSNTAVKTNRKHGRRDESVVAVSKERYAYRNSVTLQ